MSGDSIRVVRPLFPMEGQGSSPMSPLQLNIIHIPKNTFEILNKKWHSRLPDPGGFYVRGLFFGAEYKNYLFAVAGWSEPIARMLGGLDLLELRRFAIAPEAPRNTASRVLSIMTGIIKKDYPEFWKLISYQDTEVHTGTIYKACGWINENISSEGDQNWVKTHGRKSSSLQTTAAKIRWVKQLKPELDHVKRNSYTIIPKKNLPKGLFDWNEIDIGVV